MSQSEPLRKIGTAAKPKAVWILQPGTKMIFSLLEFFPLFFFAFFPLGKEDFLHQQNVSIDDLLIYSLFLSFFSLYEVTTNFFF